MQFGLENNVYIRHICQADVLCGVMHPIRALLAKYPNQGVPQSSGYFIFRQLAMLLRVREFPCPIKGEGSVPLGSCGPGIVRGIINPPVEQGFIIDITCLL